MKETGNTKTIGDAIKVLLHSPRLKKKYFYYRVKSILEDSFKGYYHQYFDRIFLKDHVLSLRITSAPLRNELTLRKNELRNKLNRELNEEYIKEIKIY